MNTSRFYKDPVHQIVDELPSSATTGFRVALTADGYIYEKNADGTWTKDVDIALGTTAACTGVYGEKQTAVKWAKSELVTEAKTPFFGTGNTMEPSFSLIWNDRIVVFRKGPGAYWDMITYLPNGDTMKTPQIDGTLTGATVDSLFNLWVAADNKLIKYRYNEPDVSTTEYTAALGMIPFDDISHIVAYGNELYVVSNPADDIKIAHYDGAEWEDLTAGLKSDLGYGGTEAGMTVYDLFVDSNGLVLISLKATGITDKLVRYNGTDWDVVAVPDAPVSISQIIKIGNVMYSIHDNDHLYVWQYDDTTILLEYVDGAHPPMALTTNSVEVISYSEDAAFLRFPAGSAAYTVDTTVMGQITALLTAYTTPMVIVHICLGLTKRVYLNNESTAPWIMKGDLAERWVETA